MQISWLYNTQSLVDTIERGSKIHTVILQVPGKANMSKVVEGIPTDHTIGSGRYLPEATPMRNALRPEEGLREQGSRPEIRLSGRGPA